MVNGNFDQYTKPSQWCDVINSHSYQRWSHLILGTVHTLQWSTSETCNLSWIMSKTGTDTIWVRLEQHSILNVDQISVTEITAFVDFVLRGFSLSVSVAETTVCECFQSPSERSVITVLTAALGFLLAARGAHGRRKPAPYCATTNGVSAALQVCYAVQCLLKFRGGMSACKVSQETQTEANKERFVPGSTNSPKMCVLASAKTNCRNPKL